MAGAVVAVATADCAIAAAAVAAGCCGRRDCRDCRGVADGVVRMEFDLSDDPKLNSKCPCVFRFSHRQSPHRVVVRVC